ncbi:hypothetical protein ACLOJK_015861 [Asimina triloba]
MDEYASYFSDIDPLSQFKTWRKQESDKKEVLPAFDVFSEEVKAAFIVSDPVDWGRDIQVLCDILTSGGLPGRKNGGYQPSLFFASDDLEYQAAFPTERLGMGAFRIALESVYNSEKHQFKTLYMIGDNPSVDVNGARKVYSREKKMMSNFQLMWYVVNTVADAIDYILEKEHA